MKSYLILILSFLISAQFVHTQKLRLVMKHNRETIFVGEKIELELILISINGVISESENYSVTSKNSFVYDFKVVPKSKGNLILGPYEISFKGKLYTSNSITLNVKDGGIRHNKIVIGIPNKGVINNPIKLSLISPKKSLSAIVLKENSNYKTVSTSTQSSLYVKDGKMKSEYKKIITLKFLKSGKFKITSEWLENIPFDLEVINTEILIEEE